MIYYLRLFFLEPTLYFILHFVNVCYVDSVLDK
jgi:hypothetical protein